MDAGEQRRAQIEDIRDGVRALCANYLESYWSDLDRDRAYPKKFVKELTDAGYLGALVPELYGGSGLGVLEAGAILEEISRSGGNPGACHAQMYVMGALVRHGSKAQKDQYLPEIASGKLRLQSFGITEPTTGTDTTSLKTTAERRGDHFIINGQKVWISRVEHSDLMLLLARTKSRSDSTRRSDGLTAFIVDLRRTRGKGLTVRPIDAMINHHSCEIFFDNLEVPAENILGELDNGFHVLLDGMNAERILIASECVGDGRYFIDKATRYANERVVFDRPIGQNQGIQFPIARAYAEIEAVALMVERAAILFDEGRHCGAESNIAKMLASEASWKAGDMCMQTHGGYSFAREYHIERKFRETRLYQIAPISTNLILSYIGEHVLGLPRSF